MQATTETAPHIEQLTRALKDKIGSEISQEELEDEFRKYLEYGVPPDQAVRTLLRHYGAPTTPSVQAPSGQVKLGDAPGNAPAIDLLARVVTLNEKEVTARGEQKTILWGLLRDDTATRPYTSWRAMEGIEAGDVIEVKGAYTKEWNNEVQFNFGDRTEITKASDDAVPDAPPEATDAKVAELRDGQRGFRLEGRILQVNARQVAVKGEDKTIFGGTFADDSGSIEFTCWDDVGLEAEQAITLEGGYVRSFRGVPQLNFDSQAKIAPAEGVPPAAELGEAPMTLADLVERGGANDVTIVATLLEVRPGSGLIKRCGETDCSRVLQGGHCFQHGKQEGSPDLRIKAILDDGTAAINAVFGKDLTEQFLGKDLDACIAEAKEAFRAEVIQEQLEEKLQGRNVRATGFARSDDYGVMLIGRTLEPYHEDVKTAAAELLEAL